MMESILTGLLFVFIALFLLASIEFVSRKSGLESEYTRKLAHVGGGLLALYFLPLIGDIYIVLSVTIVLSFVLLLTRYKRLLDSVHEVSRETLGSIIFPIPFFICFYAGQYFGNSIYFYLPILVLVFSDPAAALFGSFFGWKKYKVGKSIKSLSGSLAFFIVTLIIVTTLVFSYNKPDAIYGVLISISISLILTLVEALSGKGSDNVTVPFFAIALLYFFF